MPAIVNSGAAYIAAKVAAEQPVVIAEFVLANIAGLDDTQPVNLGEVMPQPGDIVYQAAVTQSGYLTADKVVYSLAMDTSVPVNGVSFIFNWLGLIASDGTLVAVAYVPPTEKRATSGGVQGNSITRNFLIQFADAQQATGISVPAETWQIDLSAFINAMDERERRSNRDLYGPSAFFADGWQLVKVGSEYRLQPGIGYVGGVRIVAAAEVLVSEGALPTDISLDVSLQKTVDQVVAVVTPVRGALADYTDSAGVPHYGALVAHIDGGGLVQDQRVQYAVTDDGVLKFLYDRIGEQVPQSQSATTTQKGIVELATNAETQAATDTARSVTPAGMASAVINNLTSTSTNRPLSAAQGKALQDNKVDKTQVATDAARGIVELATSSETQAGADASRAVTPAGLAAAVVNNLVSTSTTRPLSAAQGKALQDSKVDKTQSATTTQKGIVELATNTETQAGTDTARAITPAGFASAIINALTSTAANRPLSANQGKVLKGLIDNLTAASVGAHAKNADLVIPAGYTFKWKDGAHYIGANDGGANAEFRFNHWYDIATSTPRSAAAGSGAVAVEYNGDGANGSLAIRCAAPSAAQDAAIAWLSNITFDISGLNVATGELKEQGQRVYSPNNKPTLDALSGTAGNASQVGGLSASAFIRSDTSDNVTGHTEWQNGYATRWGNNGEMGAWFDGTHGFFELNTGTWYFSQRVHGGAVVWRAEDSGGVLRTVVYMGGATPYFYACFGGSQKLRTTSYGAYVTGYVNASSGFQWNGQSLDSRYLGKSAKAADSARLNNLAHSTGAAGNSIAARDPSGDSSFRLVRQTYASATTLCNFIMGQVDHSGNNYVRPMDLKTFLSAIGQVGLAASSGYIKVPVNDGGVYRVITLQWGSKSIAANSASSVTFPVTNYSTYFCGAFSKENNSGGDAVNCYAWYTGSASIINGAGSTNTCSWIAIGRL